MSPFWITSVKDMYEYRKVASSNTSRLEAQAGFIRLLMKVMFFCTVTFDRRLILMAGPPDFMN